MAARGAIRRRRNLFPPLLALILAACAGLPAIGGRPLPPATGQAGAPLYRDLAGIPDPPPISLPEANQAAIQSLTMDRARTAEAAEDLRRQPFAPPDPAPPLPPGF